MNNKKIKILHLASFLGNIGDYANHAGFYKKFKENIFNNVEFNQIEIRKFYRMYAEMKFDDRFAEMVNQYDLLVLGGGGFFDLKWAYSSSGTTIDFSKQLIHKIKVPVLVNGMGYHEFGVIDEDNVNKFRSFLETTIDNNNWFISVRNDGSFSRLHNRYGNVVDRILKIPDHGSFFCPKEYNRLGLEDNDKTWIGMCITNDLFNEKFNKDVSIDDFNDLIGQFINHILAETNNAGIILFPHTHQDLTTIGILMEKIKDQFRRTRLAVAPFYSGGGEAVDYIFDLYRVCSCVIGMRFHSNLCSIGMNVPTIGLAGHEQISSLYDELGLAKRCVKINSKQFVEELLYKLDNSLNNFDEIKQNYAKLNVGLNDQANLYYKKLNKWLSTKY
ncbi:polysaccharide pyruvyl transferase family protein [Sporomusa sp. KB1]|jgi:polysaccharide pyruvyl transferase WcaK-like protein|uniref:polysaccharide pyruvyl transferase family protein n=1 Tax=Sporomusa sp. KB1 TaxID=943346 RepID=UPI0011A61604|nr:polysaccharide pyruvyl transferase family protein [Sporomusa sp. KB1]TWH45280.1 hypothetical protein Salpa_1188 [Sporomusa sp. KB1]